MKRFILFGLLLGNVAFAQETISLSVRQREELRENSWVREIPFEKVQIASLGNRIEDFYVNPYQASEMMILPKQGGIWLTTDAGVSFASLFDHQPTQQILAAAVDWKNQLIWAATPYGLFRSEDKGKTWSFSGLSSMQNISCITINPSNPQEVLVGVQGNGFAADEKTGIFQTTDGGKTWQQKLFVGTRTGIHQIVRTEDANVLYATAWQMNNSQWQSEPFGKQSSVYKSEDGGRSWKKITINNGFASQEHIGKIGLAVFDKNRVYAVVDNRASRTRKASQSVEKVQNIHLSNIDFEKMNETEFLQIDNQKLDAYLHRMGWHQMYSANNLKQMIASGVTSPARLLNYLALKPQEVIGAEVYVTKDGGKTWQKTHQLPLDDLFYQSGEDFANIAVNPKNAEEIFVGGFALLKSEDGGSTWANTSAVTLQDKYLKIKYHPVHHHIVYVATNKGLSVSFDSGKSWILKHMTQSVSAHKIAYDETNNTLYLATNQGVMEANDEVWHKIHPSGNQIVAAEAQVYVGEKYGSFVGLNTSKNTTARFDVPYAFEDKAPLRFNKTAPMLISSQNKDIIYLGSNKLHISMDAGKNWRTISEDLTNGDKKGNKAYGTLTAIAESPFLFGLIYTGSDDGMVRISKNGGVSWQLIYNAFPKPLRVSSIVASKHRREKAIVAFYDENNGNQPFLFLTHDYGKTWTDIRTDLPNERVLVVKEDPKNEQIIYVGTENGLYVSFNNGENWHPFVKQLPNTAIKDIYIHPKDGTMYVVASGSGVYRTNISLIQSLRAAIVAQDFYPLEEKVTVQHTNSWGNTWSQWAEPVTPTVVFHAFANGSKSVKVKIKKDDVVLQSFTHQANEGFNYITYDLTISDVGKVMYERKLQKLIFTTAVNGKVYLPKGKYTIVFSTENTEEERTLEIL
ncbi:WD40/YVTN/BNR-like repeat-containing protein [Capnocytophaga canimorsus]|uniref:WD40/YVTN/BNR-like repeat-containing protein n=1 Tax=Capnocytophaga canimorsus TaxID=28188 RepID=UPI001AC3DF29|nr:hypothetical protein [Capnocytophaga canimorsus]GIM59306.1 hypothetical protein CAPN007_15140 [Capnocytophaga canimorsus]